MTRPGCEACAPLQLVGIDRAQTGCHGWAADLGLSVECRRFLDAHPDLAPFVAG